MSISERATAALAPKEMSEKDRPLSEQYRIVARAWIDADAAARILEELKTTRMESMKQGLIAKEGDMPDSHAERRVKANPEWEDYIRQMVDTRTEANRRKLQLEYIRMRFAEMQDANATSRAEMKMSR